MSAYQTFQAANDKYGESFRQKGALPIAPAKKLAIVTCMDARIDPAAHLGLNEGDAHIIRNAGGVAKDALRSIIISQQLLGTREIALFHHTGCGMLTFTTESFQKQLRETYPAHSAVIDGLDFHTFSGLEQSVKEDVQFLQDHPLVLKESKITGWIYDVETGKIKQVV